MAIKGERAHGLGDEATHFYMIVFHHFSTFRGKEPRKKLLGKNPKIEEERICFVFFYVSTIVFVFLGWKNIFTPRVENSSSTKVLKTRKKN